MASVYELQWQNQKAQVQEDMKELLAAGFSLDTSRRLASWNPTLDYDTFADVSTNQASPTPPINGLRSSLQLHVTRSPSRVNSEQLEGAVLDAGTLYAVYMIDVPELHIIDVNFSLNGVPVHHEFALPWDYAGTAGDGSANRTTFVVGSYEIEALTNGAGGPYSISASFDVE